jgi:four helix bundle protein
LKISKLEDLDVWKEARILTKIIYQITAKFPSSEQFNLTKHLRECARNIPANIAEGFGRFHYQESMQFYRIARGSLTELKSDCYTSFDCQYLNQIQLNKLLEQCEKVGRLLNGFIRSTIKVKTHTDNR